MMKRLILSIFLLILCFAIGIGSYFYIDSSAKELIEDFEQVYYFMQQEEYDKAKELVILAEEKWDNMETWYNAFLDYSQFEDLEITVPIIKTLIEDENYDLASLKILEIIQTYYSINHEQKINFANVLSVLIFI